MRLRHSQLLPIFVTCTPFLWAVFFLLTCVDIPTPFHPTGPLATCDVPNIPCDGIFFFGSLSFSQPVETYTTTKTRGMQEIFDSLGEKIWAMKLFLSRPVPTFNLTLEL